MKDINIKKVLRSSSLKLLSSSIKILEKGCNNLFKHVDNLKNKFGLNVIVAINKYKDDTELLEFLAKNLEYNCYAMDKEHDKYVGDKDIER